MAGYSVLHLAAVPYCAPLSAGSGEVRDRDGHCCHNRGRVCALSQDMAERIDPSPCTRASLPALSCRTETADHSIESPLRECENADRSAPKPLAHSCACARSRPARARDGIQARLLHVPLRAFPPTVYSAAPTNRSAPAAIIRAGPARAQIGSGVPGEDQNAQLQALFLPGVCFTAACVTAESDVRGPQGLSGVWLLAVARRETDQSTVGLSRCCSWEPDSMRQLFEADGDSFNDT